LLYFEHFQAKNLQPQNKIAKHIDKNNNVHTEICISVGDVLLAPFYLDMVLRARNVTSFLTFSVRFNFQEFQTNLIFVQLAVSTSCHLPEVQLQLILNYLAG
jgi:hypothetical protein